MQRAEREKPGPAAGASVRSEVDHYFLKWEGISRENHDESIAQ